MTEGAGRPRSDDPDPGRGVDMAGAPSACLGLPPALGTRLAAFLADGRTGRVTLHVGAGVVRAVEITESVKA